MPGKAGKQAARASSRWKGRSWLKGPSEKLRAYHDTPGVPLLGKSRMWAQKVATAEIADGTAQIA